MQHKQIEIYSEENKYIKKNQHFQREITRKNFFFFEILKAFLYSCDAVEHKSFFYFEAPHLALVPLPNTWRVLGIPNSLHYIP